MKIRVIATVLALVSTVMATSAHAIYHRDNRILDVESQLPLADTLILQPRESVAEVAQNDSAKSVVDHTIPSN